jgi:signal transduction histidine kinase
MDRHIRRELARARVAGAAGAALTDPSAAITAVLAVLKRTPDGSRLSWHVAIEPGLKARIDADDLIEGLGALAENAARHARSSVWLTAERRGTLAAVSVRDDGPGAPPEAFARIRTRGERLDARLPGHGLGLAIAAEIAEMAGGSLELAGAAPGLEATMLVPAS